MNLINLEHIFRPARNEKIYQSFLDSDFYKFSMGQFIWAQKDLKDLEVTFEVLIRSDWVDYIDVVDFEPLARELNHIPQVKLTNAEISFLKGIPLGNKNFFEREFIKDLETINLPSPKILIEKGKIRILFIGPWWQVTYTEIPALYIVSELYYFYLLKNANLPKHLINGIYSEMISRVYRKISQIKEYDWIRILEFATRRRHSADFQKFVLETLFALIPNNVIGTSNVKLAMNSGSNNPGGTNAHELPMIYAALFDDPKEIINSQYEICERWAEYYPELTILLPDTYGSTQFFNKAPASFATEWIGFRPDSKEPVEAIKEYIRFLGKHGANPLEKLVLPSDGLTVPEIIRIGNEMNGKVGRLSFGQGTDWSNDSRGAWSENKQFSQFSMACKVVSVRRPDGQVVSTVKLSDNYEKAMGNDSERLKLFKNIFGNAQMYSKKLFV